MVPTVYAGLVVLIGIFASTMGLLRAQILLCLLGGTTAVFLPALGGAVIVVPVFCLPFLVLRAGSQAYNEGTMGRMSVPGFWLMASVVWGIVLAVFMPRFLAGQVDIMTIDRYSGNGTRLIPLKPVSGNLTQSVYALGNLATFVCARYLLQPEGRLALFSRAVLGLSALTCLSAVINLAQFYAGFPDVLQYVRTAYAVFDSGEARGTGLMRIHGTFPETSAFSQFALGLMAYCASLWLSEVDATRAGVLALALLALLAFSTSGTAYAGLLLYLIMLGTTLLVQALREGRLPRIPLLFTAAVFLALVVVSLVAFESPIVDTVGRFFEITVLDKMDSESGKDRSSWNAQAAQNFVETYGFGLGMGTVRASSFALILLADLGVLGTAFYLIFLLYALRGQRPRRATTTSAISAAAAQGALAALAGAIISGATFDLGPLFYLLAAAASLTHKPNTVGQAHASPRRALAA